MGTPTSGIIAEFFLQNLEDAHLTHLSNEHKIVSYFQYVDDILIIYDSNYTDIDNIHNDFNTLHPNMKFTAETETNNKLNFLNITVHKTPTNWKISIYRKPSFTDTIIPYSSNHLAQHKYAAIKFLYNSLNIYHLHKEEYKEEENTIRGIMLNNEFPIHTHKTPTIGHPPTTPSDRKTGTHTQK